MSIYKKSSYSSNSLSIVLDIGEAYTKLGFAGETEPRSVIPTAIQQIGMYILIILLKFQVIISNSILFRVKQQKDHWYCSHLSQKKCLKDSICNPTQQAGVFTIQTYRYQI